jgi:hypothetical protein
MMYHGKLYGKLWNKYFETGKTSDDFDKMELRIKELESENLALKQANGVQASEATAILPLISGMLRSPEDIKEQALKYAKTGHDADSYDVKEKRAFEAGARWICGYEKDG